MKMKMTPMSSRKAANYQVSGREGRYCTGQSPKYHRFNENNDDKDKNETSEQSVFWKNVINKRNK